MESTEQAPTGEAERLLHERRAHPDYEYATTTDVRKGPGGGPPEGDDWEPNDFIVLYDYPQAPEGGWNGHPPIPVGRRSWERFDYHDEEYWRRRRAGL